MSKVDLRKNLISIIGIVILFILIVITVVSALNTKGNVISSPNIGASQTYVPSLAGPCWPLGNAVKDNVLSDRDAVAILDHIAGINSYSSLWDRLSADVNVDGQITAVDVALIRQYLAGRINTFPGCHTLAASVRQLHFPYVLLSGTSGMTLRAPITINGGDIISPGILNCDATAFSPSICTANLGEVIFARETLGEGGQQTTWGGSSQILQKTTTRVIYAFPLPDDNRNPYNPFGTYWKAQAEAGGTLQDFTCDGKVSLGPIYISRRMTLKTGCKLTVTGPIWVNERVDMQTGSVIKLSKTCSASTVFVSGAREVSPGRLGSPLPFRTIHYPNPRAGHNFHIFATGTRPNKYILFINYSKGQPAFDLDGANYTADNVYQGIFYAPNGTIKVANQFGYSIAHKATFTGALYANFYRGADSLNIGAGTVINYPNNINSLSLSNCK